MVARTTPLPDSAVPQSIVDLCGRVVAVNPAMARLLGEPAEELVGRDALAMYVDADREPLEAALAEIASGATHFLRQERTLRTRDGRLVDVVMTVTLVHEADGSVVLHGSVEDVSARVAAERAVREQATRFDALLQTMPVAVFTYDAAGVCTSSRGRALARLGLSDDELVGQDLLAMYTDEAHVQEALRASLRGEEPSLLGEWSDRTWETHYRPLRGDDGTVRGGIGVSHDVTERTVAEREVRANEARLRALLRHAADVVVVLDADTRILYVSPAVTAHFGYDEHSLFWQDSRSFDHPEDAPVLLAAWREALSRPGGVSRCEVRVRHADGSWRWTEHAFTNLLDDEDVRGVVNNLRDVSDRRRAELELEHRSLHDPLTGLPARGLLLDRAGRALATGRRSQRETGLVVLDVVDMAAHNLELGQARGDVLLQVVADRLSTAVREGDSLARVGGDEFAVLAEDVASVEDLRARAAMLTDAVAGALEVEGRSLDLAVRLGTALTPVADAGALLAAAELSLRRGGPVVTGPDGGNTDAVAELAEALRAGQLRLHLQPIVRLDGSPVGAEALVRWQHPTRGLLLPSAFVPLAETSGLIGDLGAWALRQACARAAAWQQEGRVMPVSVNLSPLQLGPDLVELVTGVLQETGASPSALVLEVTESALIDDPGAAGVLHALHDLGVSLALDDFGTGYSSLTYLKRFPVDAVKIDRSFVSGLGRDADDEAIVASVVSLARAVGKDVVAEGVETPAQLDVLRALGVDRAQGFLWTPALPPDQLQAWLDRQVPAAPLAPPVRANAPKSPADEDARRILGLHREGASLHTIAAALNADGLRTPDGRRWTTTTVARVIAALVRT
ncbi:MAG: hypothetical protein JWM64_101 [Frankiales bacterium]|nr:hypothetical protein [Frankiales bacterium]